MKKQLVAAAAAAIAFALVVVDVVIGGPALPGVLAGAAAIVCLAIATERELPELDYDPELVNAVKRRYRVDVVVPMAAALAVTLRTMLEEADVQVLELDVDVDHDEVIASIVVEATSRVIAERVGVRTIARLGLVDDGVRAIVL